MDSDIASSDEHRIAVTGAELLVATAVDLGIDTCFANPGTTEMALVAALDAVPGIRPVLGLFEGVCSGAADGYGRITGRPAMTLLHLGPGLANAAANLHNARRAYTPIVNVIGDHASWHLKYDAALTSDIHSLASPVSQWVHTTTATAQIGHDLAEAHRAAAVRRGPATLVVPTDYQIGPVDNPATATAAAPAGLVAVPPPRVDEVAARIRGSRSRIVLLLGGNALDAKGQDAAWRLAAQFEATLYSETFPAVAERGRTLPDLDRLPYFPEQAIQALAGADVVVLVGAKDPVAYFGYEGIPSVLAPVGSSTLLADPTEDASSALVQLAELLDAAPVPVPPRPVGGGSSQHARLTGALVGQVVAGMLPEDAIVSVEGGTCGYPFFTASASSAQHTVMTNTGGAIGQGLPCALGAAIAAPHRPVIAVQSDGSAQYTLQALWTMARERCDVTVLIAANQTYNVLRTELDRHGTTDRGPAAQSLTSLGDPAIDWLGLARGYGVDAVRVHTTGGLAGAITDALSAPGPHLIEMAI